jgi:hypothetical protein
MGTGIVSVALLLDGMCTLFRALLVRRGRRIPHGRDGRQYSGLPHL